MGKIKEFYLAKDEDELLHLVILWPESDEEWYRGGEWIIQGRTMIKLRESILNCPKCDKEYNMEDENMREAFIPQMLQIF